MELSQICTAEQKLLISRMRHYFNTMIKIVSQLTGVKIMILLLLNFKRVTSHLTMGLTSHYIMMQLTCA